MSSISTIAVSGMNAAARRLEVSAANVANVTDHGRAAQRGRHDASRGAKGLRAAGAGPDRVRRRWHPDLRHDGQAGHDRGLRSAGSLANQNGLVAAPNVDLAREMVSQLVARYSFAANATVMKADDRMTKTLLDIKA